MLWCVSQLPFRLQILTGKALGILAFYVAPRRRNIAEINIRLCFPELSSRQRKSLLKKHFESLGLWVIELGLSWWSPEDKIRKLVAIEGLEHIERALKNKQGIILLVSHLTTMEISGNALGYVVPFYCMHRSNENPLVAKIMEHGRRRAFKNSIHHHDLRKMITVLKNGKAVWYAPDQNYRGRGSIDVPFFNVPAPSSSGTSRLAKMSNAIVIPFYTVRLPDYAGYRLVIQPPIDNFPSDDAVKDTGRIMKIVEQQVREHPEDYIWIHRRFKRHDSSDVYR